MKTKTTCRPTAGITEIELLVDPDDRRPNYDPAADPIHDHYSHRKGNKQTNHLLSILDNLEKGANQR